MEDIEITWQDKYHPDNGHSPLSHPSNEFTQCMEKFAAGTISMEETARYIIDALFRRDFMPGKHWNDCGSHVKLIKTHDSGALSYYCQHTAEWDWKDICAEAKASAIISMSQDRKRIRLDKYSYYCAG